MEVPNKGKEIVGKYGVYTLQDKIGQGGNGTVFDISISRQNADFPAHECGYVIKILAFNKNRNEKECEKRKERFQREVEVLHTIRTLQPSCELAVIPIIDSYLDVANPTCEWYVMPKAKEYRYYYGSSIEKLKQLKNVGNTLQTLHSHQIYHRDIKPANILFYGNRCCLSDFGLVWSINDSHITDENEALGPISIRPPEMEYDAERLSEQIDFQKVDSYLFVKTAWIVLTGNRNGFRGQYQRSDKMIYLEKSKLRLGKTLEPLHLMMEEATVHANANRIAISKCLKYIEIQISIAEGKTDDNTINALLFDEMTKEAITQISTDVVVFESTSKIEHSLTKMEGIVEFIIDEYGETSSLGILNKVERLSDDLYKVNLQNDFAISGENRTIIMNIAHVNISKDNTWSIETDQIFDKNMVKNEEIVYDVASLIKTTGIIVSFDGKATIMLKKLH